MGVTDRPQYLVAVIKPRLDRVEDAERHLRALMAGTHQEPGCIYMELVISDDDPDTWLMLEKFTSRADWEAHMLTPHVIDGNRNLADLLREPTELRFYTAKE